MHPMQYTYFFYKKPLIRNSDSQIAKTLTGKESLQEILNIALSLEKQSILFYVGLKDLVRQKHGKDKVDAIIGEEKQHIAQLSEVLRNAQGS